MTYQEVCYVSSMSNCTSAACSSWCWFKQCEHKQDVKLLYFCVQVWDDVMPGSCSLCKMKCQRGKPDQMRRSRPAALACANMSVWSSSISVALLSSCWVQVSSPSYDDVGDLCNRSQHHVIFSPAEKEWNVQVVKWAHPLCNSTHQLCLHANMNTAALVFESSLFLERVMN